jgi:hypothetical protein
MRKLPVNLGRGFAGGVIFGLLMQDMTLYSYMQYGLIDKSSYT